jgi:hypothetical protein
MYKLWLFHDYVIFKAFEVIWKMNIYIYIYIYIGYNLLEVLLSILYSFNSFQNYRNVSIIY